MRLLNLVSQRFKKDEHPSSVEKGIAIRTVLNEAFERLRGQTVRNDSDPALQNYNILHYQYFKKGIYHLNNDQIAARIGFSVRQYYRYRSKAIEALLLILIETENASNIEVEVEE